MTCGIEDAGFEIRDQILWIFGSGFPKSHNGEWGGTALKPAHEPIVVARKPLEGTVAENWRKWGTGALNIDGCRIETEENLNGGAYSAAGERASSQSLNSGGMNRPGATADGEFVQPVGRWPANVIHDGSDEVLAAFPDAPGQMADASASASASARKTQNVYGAMRCGRGDEASADSENAGAVGFRMRPGTRRLDAGSAARFFYCAKTSKRDRNEGLEGLEGRRTGDGRQVPSDNAYQRGKTDRQNHHPTVKPTDLMRYLCRLVTPAGGMVLDPFAGSGSTLKAAVLEGFDVVGIELSDEYVAIAQRRVEHALKQVEEEAAQTAADASAPVNLDLFAEEAA
jgi:site-specific DNA-methyltransferase (adenine-specific)